MRDNNKPMWIIGIGFGIFLLFLFGGYIVYPLTTEDKTQFTVKRLERVNNGDSSYYLVFTKQGEVLSNTDSLVHGKFNSSTIYGELEKGNKYKANVYGWRVPFLSMYRNIISTEKVDK